MGYWFRQKALAFYLPTAIFLPIPNNTEFPYLTFNKTGDLNWQLVNNYLPGIQWSQPVFSIITKPGQHLISYISEYTLNSNFHKDAPSKDLITDSQTLALLLSLKLTTKYGHDFTNVQRCIFLITPTRAGPSLI